MDFEDFVDDVPTLQQLNHQTGQFDVLETAPAVWTLAHKGRSGMGRLDIWVYPDELSACRAGAKLAIDCWAHDEEAQATLQPMFKVGKFREIMQWYEDHEREDMLLRVQSALFVDREAEERARG